MKNTNSKSPKEEKNKLKADSEENFELHQVFSEISNHYNLDYSQKENQKFKKNLINNLKILYDRDSSRNKKRTEQIKRIRNSKSVTSADLEFFTKTNSNNEENNFNIIKVESLSNTFREKSANDLNNISKRLLNQDFILNQAEKNNKINDLETLDKATIENCNSQNVSSLNITYINTVNTNINLKENNLTNLEYNNKNEDVFSTIFNDKNHDKNYFKNNNFFNNRINENINNEINKNIASLELQNECKLNNKINKQEQIQNAILNVSDLDFHLDEDENEDIINTDITKNKFNNNNLLILKNMNKKNASFINIKNNLKIKSDIEENMTQSYLMALQGYTGNNDEDEEDQIEETKIQNFMSIINDENSKKKFSLNIFPVHNKSKSENINFQNIYKEEYFNKEKYPANSCIDEDLNSKHSNINIQEKNFFELENNNINEIKIENQRFPRRSIPQNQQGHGRSKSQEVTINNIRIPSVKKIS